MKCKKCGVKTSFWFDFLFGRLCDKCFPKYHDKLNQIPNREN